MCYEVRAPDAEVASWVERLFPAYLIDDEASGLRTFEITRGPGGFVVGGRGRGSIGATSSVELAERVEFVLTRAILEDATDAVHLHAAGCAGPSGVVLAAGASGAGKSSLAAYWWARGLPVMGDDVVFLEPDRTVAPFKRQFKVHPGLLRRLGVDLRETPFWSAGSSEAWLDPGEWAVPAAPAVIAFVQYEPASGLRVRSLSRREALHALLFGALDGGVGGEERFDRVADAVREAERIEVRFGSVAAAGDFLAREAA